MVPDEVVNVDVSTSPSKAFVNGLSEVRSAPGITFPDTIFILDPKSV